MHTSIKFGELLLKRPKIGPLRWVLDQWDKNRLKQYFKAIRNSIKQHIINEKSLLENYILANTTLKNLKHVKTFQSDSLRRAVNIHQENSVYKRSLFCMVLRLRTITIVFQKHFHCLRSQWVVRLPSTPLTANSSSFSIQPL